MNIHEVLEYGPIVFSNEDMGVLIGINGSYLNWFSGRDGEFENTECRSYDKDAHGNPTLYTMTVSEAMQKAEDWYKEMTNPETFAVLDGDNDPVDDGWLITEDDAQDLFHKFARKGEHVKLCSDCWDGSDGKKHFTVDEEDNEPDPDEAFYAATGGTDWKAVDENSKDEIDLGDCSGLLERRDDTGD